MNNIVKSTVNAICKTAAILMILILNNCSVASFSPPVVDVTPTQSSDGGTPGFRFLRTETIEDNSKDPVTVETERNTLIIHGAWPPMTACDEIVAEPSYTPATITLRVAARFRSNMVDCFTAFMAPFSYTATFQPVPPGEYTVRVEHVLPDTTTPELRLEQRVNIGEE